MNIVERDEEEEICQPDGDDEYSDDDDDGVEQTCVIRKLMLGPNQEDDT